MSNAPTRPVRNWQRNRSRINLPLGVLALCVVLAGLAGCSTASDDAASGSTSTTEARVTASSTTTDASDRTTTEPGTASEPEETTTTEAEGLGLDHEVDGTLRVIETSGLDYNVHVVGGVSASASTQLSATPGTATVECSGTVETSVEVSTNLPGRPDPNPRFGPIGFFFEDPSDTEASAGTMGISAATSTLDLQGIDDDQDLAGRGVFWFNAREPGPFDCEDGTIDESVASAFTESIAPGKPVTFVYGLTLLNDRNTGFDAILLLKEGESTFRLAPKKAASFAESGRPNQIINADGSPVQ